MTNYNRAIIILQLILLCSCSCYSSLSSRSWKPQSFVEVLAKLQSNEKSDSALMRQTEGNGMYSVILSSDEDNDEAYKYQQEKQQQFSQKYQGAATGNYQQQQQQQLNPLLKQASTASICILFVLLIWRSLAAYELADQFNSGSLRILAVAPTVLILCANLMGFVINVMKPFNFKNFLKFILALNISREFVELLYNVVMLVANSPNSGISRDIYFGRFFMNVWWLSLCVTFSKSRWVLQIIPSNNNNAMGNNGYQQQQNPRYSQSAQENNQKYY
jgi:hypothetical protein